MKLTHCFYKPGEIHIQDIAVQDKDGAWVGFYSGDSSEAMEARTGAVLRDFEEACAEITKAERERFVKPAVRITAEAFNDALNVLPPCRWNRGDYSEWFHVSERLTGDLVNWYVRSGDRYYTFVDSAHLPSGQLLERIK